MDFANKVRELLKDRKLSQADLAEALGTNQQQVSRWLEGNNPPKWDYLLRMARFFDVTTDYLLGHEVAHPAPALPEDEAAILRLYRNLKSRGAIDESLATHGIALATKGIFVGQAETVTPVEPTDLPGPPPGIDPSYRAPTHHKVPFSGIIDRLAEEKAERERLAEEAGPRRTPRKKPG